MECWDMDMDMMDRYEEADESIYVWGYFFLFLFLY